MDTEWRVGVGENRILSCSDEGKEKTENRIVECVNLSLHLVDVTLVGTEKEGTELLERDHERSFYDI